METQETKKMEKQGKAKFSLKQWWKAKTRAKKVTLAVEVLFFLISIAVGLILVYCRQIFGNETGDAILGKGIENGWIWIGERLGNSGIQWLLTFLVVVIAFMFVFVFTAIVRACTSNGRKAQTVGSLICSLIKYISILVGVGFVLAIWGVDVTGIMAGVSIVTLIVGLGCQSLIQDVVSGLFIVFDDYFAVGDIVIIDGFRGTVHEVGLKTTKLIDAGGNIKSITNSSITTVVNLSREDSLVSVLMDSSYNEDVERVEAVIAQALPTIAKQIPAITQGPFYKGINNFDDGGISFQVIAFCKEGDRFQVQRDLNRELYQLFIRNDIIVPYKQLVINQPDPTDRPKASSAEQKAAKAVTNENRGIGVKKEKKRKSFVAKVTESFEENVSQLESK